MEQGFTWLKMDLGIDLVRERPGTLTAPARADRRATAVSTQHMFTGIELTDKGRRGDGRLRGARCASMVGMDMPLSADHFGHIGVNSCIRLGKALEKYNMAWLEDMIPWQYTDLLKKITDAVDMPTAHRRRHLSQGSASSSWPKNHAVDILHPDLATSGGILETKKIGDAIQEYGVADGDALRRHAGLLHGERPLRRGDRELPGAGESLGGRALVERPGGRRREADRQSRASSPCRRSRAWASR